MEACVLPLDGVAPFSSQRVEVCLPLCHGIGEVAESVEDGAPAPVCVERYHMGKLGKLRPLRVDDRYAGTMVIGSGKKGLEKERDDARGFPLLVLPATSMDPDVERSMEAPLWTARI